MQGFKSLLAVSLLALAGATTTAFAASTESASASAVNAAADAKRAPIHRTPGRNADGDTSAQAMTHRSNGSVAGQGHENATSYGPPHRNHAAAEARDEALRADVASEDARKVAGTKDGKAAESIQ